MALVVESTSSATTTNSASVTVTKPTGVTTGDLLLITGVAYGNVVSCTGFTTAVSKVQDNPGSLEDSLVTILYKIADSSDEAASNYTVSGGGTSMGAAAMYRISGWTSGNPVYVSSNTGGSADAASYSVGASSLALNRPASSLMIITVVQCSEENGATYSGYSVTSGESNPTWTEVLDSGALSTQSSLRDVAIGTAYANSTSTSDITAWTLTATSSIDGDADGYAAILAVLVEPTDDSGTNNLLLIDNPTFFTEAAVEVGTIGSNNLLEPTTELFNQSGNFIANTQWSNESKPSTSWTNPDK